MDSELSWDFVARICILDEVLCIPWFQVIIPVLVIGEECV